MCSQKVWKNSLENVYTNVSFENVYNCIKKGLKNMCFLVTFANLLNTFFKEHVQTTASVWAVFLENILLIKVCFETITNTKNAAIFMVLASHYKSLNC